MFLTINLVSAFILHVIISLLWSYFSNSINANKEDNKCKCMDDDCIKKTYLFLYDNINKLLQYFSKIITSKDNTELIIILIVLLLSVILGNYLGTVGFIVLVLDIYIALGYKDVKNILKALYELGFKYIKEKDLIQYIPKYKQE